MFQRKYAVIVVCLLVLALIFILVFRKSGRNQLSEAPSPIAQPSYTPIPTPNETPTPVVAPKELKLVSTSLAVSGINRGQITCNYQVPAVPNEYGVAELDSNWNNLVIGKNGTAKLDVCVSVNGTSGLMSEDSHVNGSRVDSAPWISLNSNYTFTLYDEHGGNLPDCGGVVLSSCQINTD